MRLVGLPSGIEAAPNILANVGGETTVTLADERLLIPCVEATWTLLLLTPVVVPLTFTVTVQDELNATAPEARLTTEAPDVAVARPPQLLDRPSGVATTRPAGKLSVNPTFCSDTPLAAGLVMVMEREVVPLSGRVPAPKAEASVGATAGTVTLKLFACAHPPPPEPRPTRATA
ncbi:MAG: hypothetical protein IPJ28_13890 [Betaproteobacteria bacterium]|nr:hypothetical protein [Betaproteobacteria bacterium]